VYSERSNIKHLEEHHHSKVMSVLLSGTWSVASDTCMFMVAWTSDLYRYFDVCYPIYHVGYTALSSPESINIINVTRNPFTIFALEAFSCLSSIDTTFFPFTSLVNRDAIFISCRGRGSSHRKRGQLFIFCLPHSLWFQEICVIY
jgi:hypothetical protein